ncbi:MAG: alkaline ceramidase [Bacteroidota bacterium]
MKHAHSTFAILLFIFVITGYSNAQSFQVGAAMRNINPDKDSLYLAGGKPNRPFMDVHDDLHVKAIHIDNGKQNITLLTFDCIGLLHPVLEEIRAEIRSKSNDIAPEHIVMSSTHTHAGPDVVGIWGKDFTHTGVVDRHMMKIKTNAVEAILEARSRRAAASMEYAVGEHGEDWVKNISEPTELDRTLSVIRFRNAQQKNIATLTNFACHPTIMDDATTAASADYVWGYYRYMDSLQGGVNAFFQGSIGGWIQPEDVPSSFEQANFYGTRLAQYASGILKKGKRSATTDMWFRSNKVEFPVANPMFKVLSKNGIIKRSFGENVQSEIAFFQIGDAQFATHPGETVPQMSWDTKKLMKTNGPKFVIGLGQDALGYILKPTFFDASKQIPHSDYLTGMSVGPQTMEIIMRTLQKLANH